MFLALAACAALGCGPAGARGGAESADGTEEAARLNRAKCGSCHAPRRPGTRTLEELDGILGTHKSQDRARLRDDEWETLKRFLAKK